MIIVVRLEGSFYYINAYVVEAGRLQTQITVFAQVILDIQFNTVSAHFGLFTIWKTTSDGKTVDFCWLAMD